MLLIAITSNVKGDKNKNLSPEEHLDMIRPYDHKTPKKLRVHSCNELIDYKTYQYEWKI